MGLLRLECYTSHMNLLTIRNLAFGFNEEPLFAELDLSLTPGEVLHLRGPNGVGKTTLLRILAGFIVPHQGKITWQDENSLLYMGTRLGVKAGLTVRDNLRLHADLSGGCCSSDLENAMQQLGLTPFADQLVSSLSTGLTRRVALCRLLAPKRQLWLLDEPFSGLDADSLAWLSTAIANHARHEGAVVFTSHQPVVIENTSVREMILCRSAI